jgi:hypothetical protein
MRGALLPIPQLAFYGVNRVNFTLPFLNDAANG